MQATNNFFQLLQKGIIQIDRTKTSAYIIIGVTRVGKTCLYNHLRNKSMIGKIDPHHKQRVIYEPLPKEGQGLDTYAMMSAHMDSFTIAPNISDLGDGCSLIDLAGFEQNRDYNEIMAVSYFLLSCFQKLKRIKFILAFTQDELTSARNYWTSTLDKFLNLFRINLLTPALKQNFLNSISIVATRAVEKQEYVRECLQNILNQLAQERNLRNQPNKPLFIEVFKRVAEKNRIQIFEQANTQAVIQKSEIINSLNRLGWQFFNLEQAQTQINTQLLVVPFYQDYEGLTNAQRERLNKSIQEQVSNLIKLNQIFKISLNSLNQRLLVDEQWNSSAIFTSIQKLLDQFYPYHSISVNFTSDFKLSDGLQINSIITKAFQLYDLNIQLEKISNKAEGITFQQKLDSYKEIYVKMVECLKPLCTQQQHSLLLEKLKYRFRREFQQFGKIYKLIPNIITDIGRKMMDQNTISITSDASKLKFFSTFINKLNTLTPHALITYFKDETTLNSLKQLVQMYRKYVHQDKSKEQTKQQCKQALEDIQFKLSLLNTEISSAKIGILSAKRNENTLSEYCKFMDTLRIQSICIEKLNKTAEEKEKLITDNYHKKMGTINDLCSLLLELHSNTNPDFRKYALQLSELVQNVHLSQMIYELMLNQPNQSDDSLLTTLNNYATWCKKWGNIEQAKKLLFHKIFIFQKSKNFAKLKQVQKQLQELLDKSQTIIQQSRALIDKMFTPFSQAETSTYIVGQIDEFLKRKQSNSN